MKKILIVALLIGLTACASFPPGTKTAPAFPDDPFDHSM
jgi:starvation-inducible outer membrane lipoprotein